MRNRTLTVTAGFMLLAGVSALPGCDGGSDSFEQAGEEIDETIEEAGDAIEDAADELEDATDAGRKGS